MEFVLDRQRISASKAAQLLLAALIALVFVAPTAVFAQLGRSEVGELGNEGRDFRSVKSGRWVDQETWAVYRSGQWIPALAASAGVPDANRNVFIETNHTIIATRADVQNQAGGRDYNGNQSQAFIEVNNLHINTAASITTTWGSVIGGFRRAVDNADAGVNPFVAEATGAIAALGFDETAIVTDAYDGDRFGGYVNPDPAFGNAAIFTPGFVPTPNATQGSWWDGSTPGTLVNGVPYVESIPAGTAGWGSAGSTLQTVFAGHPDPAVRAAGAAGLDPASGFQLRRPRNNELRVYGKLRYYAGAAADQTDRDAGIQVTAATIGTGSTIVFRGGTRMITQADEWSTTFATVAGYNRGADPTFGNAFTSAGEKTAHMQAGSLVSNPELRNRYKSLMGRNSFWTAVFDLGRVRDRGTSRDLYVSMNDRPEDAIGTIGGNFTAGIIQVRRGTVRVAGSAFLANEGAATSGSIQICNNAVLQIAGSAQIGRTAVPVARGTMSLVTNYSFTSYQYYPAAASSEDGYAQWGYNNAQGMTLGLVAIPAAAGVLGTFGFVLPNGTTVAVPNVVNGIAGGVTMTGIDYSANNINAPAALTIATAPGVSVANPNGHPVPNAGAYNMGGAARFAVGLPLTPQGTYAVTSRMRYFVVEEGGALDFFGPTGIEISTNVGSTLSFPNVNPTNNNFTLGSTLSAADVRFNGTVIYSRTGDQTLVQDSPFLSHNPVGLTINTANGGASTPQIQTVNDGAGAFAAVTGSANIGENGLYDPYNNLRDPYNTGAYTILGVGPALVQQTAVGTAGYGVGAAGIFAPSTTAAYSHLTLRGSGNKFLLGTTITISRSLIIQGFARLWHNPIVNPQLTTPIGNANLSTNVANGFQGVWGVGVPTAVAANPVAGAGTQGNLLNTRFASRFAGYPALAYLRSTGLRGYLEENNVGTTRRTSLAGTTNAGGAIIAPGTTDNGEVETVPMWSAYGGNTDPVAFVGFTTASTSIVPQDNDLSYPIGMVLSGSTNREQIDMTPWNKPSVVHGLPAEPSYVGPGQGVGTHGWSFRGQQYGVQELSGARFGQVIRQSIDRVNGDLVLAGSGFEGVMRLPFGLNQMSSVAATFADNLIATNHRTNGVGGNFPMITNSLYDYSINTTATTTLQYDTELGDAMTQVEFAQGQLGPHNLVLNSPVGNTQILPLRTNTGYKFGTNAFTAVVYGVTAGTVIVGPEYTNSTNGNLPRQAFDPRYDNSDGIPYYQANAEYSPCNAPGANSDNGLVTAGVLASAFIDTRPDMADQSKVYKDGPGQTTYTSPSGVRPATSTTTIEDGRVRVGFPRYFTQIGAMMPYLSASLAVGTNGIIGNNGFIHGALAPGGGTPRRLPTNAPSDFGRRGDFNNFGVVELRRGVLELPAQNIDVETAQFNTSNRITASGFPDGSIPNGGIDARRFTYTLTLSSTAIISKDQQNVTYRGKQVGAGNTDRVFVVLSDSPNGGDRGTPGISSSVGVVGGTITGGANLRGPAGPANLQGTLKGGSQPSLIVTGGAGQRISTARIATDATAARTRNGGNLTTTYGYEPPTYGSGGDVSILGTDGAGNEGDELNVASGVVGVVAERGAKFTTTAAGTFMYNPGPEKYSDVEFTNTREGVVTRDETTTGSGRPTDNNAGSENGIVAHSGTNIRSNDASAVFAFGQVVRANNAYNLDMPRVEGGFNHLTMMRATTNVITLVGNLDNRSNGPDGVTSTNAERAAGLMIYGTIATVRGDIDLNGRNIELSSNRAKLIETYNKMQVVDSLTGRLFWTADQQSLPRPFAAGVVATRSAPVNTIATEPGRARSAVGYAFPVLPNTVRNENRSARAYIGLSSPRNIVFQNDVGGVTEGREEVAGLGAAIFMSGNPLLLRVRRWQTRGDGRLGIDASRTTNQGNVQPRGIGTGIDRYWQIETTGSLSNTAVRSSLRLQYVDTDLNNDNGCNIVGIAPTALNIFRTAGQPTIGAQNYPNDGFDPNVLTLRNWQALFAKQAVGRDMYNIHKQLTINSQTGTQTVAGQLVLEVSNFSQIGPNTTLAGGQPGQNDPNNAQLPNSGFQMWSIGVTAPRCFVVRGQRFGGAFASNIGGPGADIDYTIGLTPAGGLNPQDPTGGFATIRNTYTSTLASGGGVQPATATLYGPYVGPFKAGIATNATVIVEILDDFDNVAAASGIGYRARLRISDNNPGATSQPTFITGGFPSTSTYSSTSDVRVSGANSTQGGRFEWTNLAIAGTASTNLTLSVVAVDSAGNALTGTTPNIPTGYLPMCTTTPAGAQVSLQGGMPFRVEFDSANSSATGQIAYKVPGRVYGSNGQLLPGAQECLTVGQDVNFGTTFQSNNNITVVVRDRFGNLASLPTQVHLSLAGGAPVIDPVRTAVLNGVRTTVANNDGTGLSWGLGKFGLEVTPSSNPPATAFYDPAAPAGGIPALFSQLTAAQQTAWAPNTNILLNNSSLTRGRPEIHHPQVNTHYVTFPGFRVIGATSNNVTLVASLPFSDLLGLTNIGTGTGTTLQGGNALASVNLCAGPAARLAPVPLQFDAGRPVTRIPESMFIGRTSRTFYVQAVDIFGNRVLNYTSLGAGDKIATITFPTGTDANNPPYDPFDDTKLRPNDPTKTYGADNITAPAVNGLYTYDRFVPRSPVSTTPLDILLSFRDPQLTGGANQNSGFFPTLPGFRPQPVTTTASTSFYPVPTVTITTTAAGPSESAEARGTSLRLRERAVTFNGDTGAGVFPSGTVRIGFPTGTTLLGNPGIISYSLGYRSAAGAALPQVALDSMTLPAALPAGFRLGTPNGQFPTPAAAAFIVNGRQGAAGGNLPIDSTVGGLRDDLSPTTTDNNNQVVPVTLQSEIPVGTGVGGTGSISLNQTRLAQDFNFRARYSDQRWDDPATAINERTPGIQRIRTVTIKLYADTVGTNYALDPAASVGTVTLDDPPRRRPALENAIQDRELQLTREEITELESKDPRADNGRPSWVFYDDNYDPLVYRVEFDNSVIAATLLQRDTARFQGRPSLTYRPTANARKDTRTTIRVFATDSDGNSAQDEFEVKFVDPRTGATSVTVDPSEVKLTVSPNPTTDKVVVSAVAKATGSVKIDVVNAMGQTVATFTQATFNGQEYRQVVDLAGAVNGTYTIRVNDGVAVSAQRVIKAN